MEIRSFLRLAGYYYRFVEISRVTTPLTKLTKEDIRFELDDSYELTFMELKQRLTNTPVLIILDSLEPYVVYIDDSGTMLGCVLT